MNRPSLFFLGGIFGVIIVRAFCLAPLEEIGWRMFWAGISNGKPIDIGLVLKSSAFAKAAAGFMLGGLIAVLIFWKNWRIKFSETWVKSLSPLGKSFLIVVVLFYIFIIMKWATPHETTEYQTHGEINVPPKGDIGTDYDAFHNAIMSYDTELKRNEYVKGLRGMQIAWRLYVSDVEEKKDAYESTYAIYLSTSTDGIPLTIFDTKDKAYALSFSKGYRVTYKAVFETMIKNEWIGPEYIPKCKDELLVKGWMESEENNIVKNGSEANSNEKDIGSEGKSEIDKEGNVIAEDAQSDFNIGETYYTEKKYEDAIIAYESFLKKDYSNDKAKVAMLKQAYSFIEIDDKKTGKVILERIIERYPQSAEAELARKKINELIRQNR